MRLFELVELIQTLAPSDLAEQWDNPGLQVGSLGKEITRIGFALDATLPIVKQAIEKGCDLLLAHHPLIFKPLKNINFQNETGAIVEIAAQNGLAIYAAHTNWDSSPQGVGQALADFLGLDSLEPLQAAERDFYKVVVFVPPSHADVLRQAIFAVGAGQIGAYDKCSFAAPGEGGFRSPSESRPFIGEPGSVSTTAELRLELILPAKLAPQVSQAIFAHHPYEEPAFEFYPIKTMGPETGLGRMAIWPEARDLLAELKRLGLPFKWAGPAPRHVRRVALLPGSGGSFVALAKAKGAEALITGDAGHHHALEAQALGLSLIDLGHHGTEWPGVIQLERLLRKKLLQAGRTEVECLLLAQPDPWCYWGENGGSEE